MSTKTYPTKEQGELHVRHFEARAELAERHAREALAVGATGLASSLEREALECRDRARMLAAMFAAAEMQLEIAA